MRSRSLPALAALLLLASGAGAAPNTATDAAKAFYKVYLALGSAGGVPDAPARAKLSPVITEGLKRLLVDADKAEERHQKATKGEEPPMIEGDPFTSLFEGATAYEVTSCEESGTTATCAIALSADDGKGGKVAWTDQAMMARVGDGWRLDNIKYGGTWEFGLHGDLRAVLADVIKEK